MLVLALGSLYSFSWRYFTSRIRHPEPTGSREATPPGKFQQNPGHPLAALEDRVIQRAVVEVLNVIYETDFLGYSYGFRPPSLRLGQAPGDSTMRWTRLRLALRARR